MKNFDSEPCSTNDLKRQDRPVVPLPTPAIFVYDQFSSEDEVQTSSSEEDISDAASTLSVFPYGINNFNEQNKDIILSCDNFEDYAEIKIIRKFARFFCIRFIEPEQISSLVTHLVVKTYANGRFNRTTNVGNAIVSNRAVMNLKWVTESLASKSLMPEHDYMPMDSSGSYSTLDSWRVGRGIIHSKMDWTSKCMLYLYAPHQINQRFNSVVEWTRQLGFKVTNQPEDLMSKEFDLKIILVDFISSRVLHKSDMIRWLKKYTALTVYINWIYDVVFQYTYIELNTNYFPLKFLDLDSTDRDEILEFSGLFIE